MTKPKYFGDEWIPVEESGGEMKVAVVVPAEIRFGDRWQKRNFSRRRVGLGFGARRRMESEIIFPCLAA